MGRGLGKFFLLFDLKMGHYLCCIYAGFNGRNTDAIASRQLPPVASYDY